MAHVVGIPDQDDALVHPLLRHGLDGVAVTVLAAEEALHPIEGYVRRQRRENPALWPPGEQPLPIKPRGGRGRPSTRVRHTAEHKPVSAKALAHALPEQAWQTVTWREGGNATLSGRFAAVRVRPAHRDVKRSTPRPEE